MIEIMKHIGFKKSLVAGGCEAFVSYTLGGEILLVITLEDSIEAPSSLDDDILLGNGFLDVFEGKLREIVEIFASAKSYEELGNHFDHNMLLINRDMELNVPNCYLLNQRARLIEKLHLPNCKRTEIEL